MPDSPRPLVPTSIDRASVDRILARALELQSASSNDPEGRLTETQLEALQSATVTAQRAWCGKSGPVCAQILDAYKTGKP